MSNTKVWNALTLTLGLMSAVVLPPAYADYISPGFKDKGHEYTEEKPDSSFYGEGQGGRLCEASELRLTLEGLIRDHKWEEAIKKGKKAVQLEPSYPENHLLLARALVGKLFSDKGTIDEKLLAEALREWRLIQWYDVDTSNQMEARGMTRHLGKIAKTLEKDRHTKAKLEEKKKAAELLAKKAEESTKPSTVSGDGEKVVTGKTLDDVHNQLAAKQKKRWLLF
jgi:hypothetical protein